MPAQIPGGDRPFVQESSFGQNIQYAPYSAQLPGGQQNPQQFGLPNDGDSVEDPDSKDLSANRQKVRTYLHLKYYCNVLAQFRNPP
jgi:hypothetical protein